MELIGIGFGGIFALVSLILCALLKFQGPKKKVFPSCYECGNPMVQLFYYSEEVPEEIDQYLSKYGLPWIVVRRFICPKSHRELWIAPPVAGEQRGVIVSRKP